MRLAIDSDFGIGKLEMDSNRVESRWSTLLCVVGLSDLYY